MNFQSLNPDIHNILYPTQADRDRFARELSTPVQSLIREIATAPPPRIGNRLAPPPLFQITSQPIGNILMRLLEVSVRCFSSKAMSHLMGWRNPLEHDLESPPLFKKIITQISLPVLTVTASIEFVAYRALELGAEALSPITTGPRELIRKHRIDLYAESARVTIWWTIDASLRNFREVRLESDEFEVRDRFR